jgi:7-cyano-7-deazaguanine synthase
MKAITLLSSGLDSVAALAIAAENFDIELAITFDYGQRARTREIEYSQKLCEYFEIEHRVVKLDWLSEITSTSLVNTDTDVPCLSFEDIDKTAPAEITAASAKAV